MDSRLKPYLESTDEGDAERVLGDIMTSHAAPVVRSIVRAKLGGSPDASDVESGVTLELIARIRAMRTCPDTEPIEDLPSYAATAAHNACIGHFRRTLRERSPANLLQQIGEEDTPGASLDTAPGPYRITQARLYAQRLWEEIRLLPVNQRLVLLLNLKGDAIYLFPLCGVASIRQIAPVLEMPPEKLASLWNDLPLDDSALAAQLRLSRQQVINLRMAARKRLANRLKDWR